jgi:hypothetical protein
VAFNYWCFGSKVLKWHSTKAANARWNDFARLVQL